MPRDYRAPRGPAGGLVRRAVRGDETVPVTEQKGPRAIAAAPTSTSSCGSSPPTSAAPRARPPVRHGRGSAAGPARRSLSRYRELARRESHRAPARGHRLKLFVAAWRRANWRDPGRLRTDQYRRRLASATTLSGADCESSEAFVSAGSSAAARVTFVAAAHGDAFLLHRVDEAGVAVWVHGRTLSRRSARICGGRSSSPSCGPKRPNPCGTGRASGGIVAVRQGGARNGYARNHI